MKTKKSQKINWIFKKTLTFNMKLNFWVEGGVFVVPGSMVGNQKSKRCISVHPLDAV